MVTNPQFFYVSPEVYLEGERVSPVEHEYRKGQIYAMVGAKKPHIVLASNLANLCQRKRLQDLNSLEPLLQYCTVGNREGLAFLTTG